MVGLYGTGGRLYIRANEGDPWYNGTIGGTMAKKSVASVYVVLCGSFDEGAEDVRIVGVYATKRAAYAARDAEYKSSVDEEEYDDADLGSSYVDNEHEFWSIEQRPLL